METVGKHFVLVHGAGHGAWCWYKVVSLLKLSGHHVTALDLGGCGTNPKRLDEVSSFTDYVQPLMEFMASLPPDEKVVLVGHSFGGYGISLATEKFPKNVAVAVYVTACMPNFSTPPQTLVLEAIKRGLSGKMSDIQLFFEHGQEMPPTSGLFGPKHLALLYRNCPPEDLELGKMLVKKFGTYIEDLGKENMLTEDRFGRVRRVYIVCEEDKGLTEEFQRWMISNSPPSQEMSIAASGHMPMLSKPKELSLILQQIAQRYH